MNSAAKQSGPETVMPGLATLSGEDVDLANSLDFGPWTLQQKLVALMAALTVIFDGMDIQIMGFAIPAIAKDWHIARANFQWVLALGLFGVTIGTALGGFVGDRFGRRVALLMNVLLFALATLSMAFSHSLSSLLIFRFFAGLGIGGALPNAATLTAEYTPLRRRPAVVTLAIVCIPLGGLIAGLISAQLLNTHTWRTLFLVGGFGPLLLLVILATWLPESPRFLARFGTRRTELQRVLQRIGRQLTAEPLVATPLETNVSREPIMIGQLFSGSLTRDTLALWAAFFLCLTTAYLAFNWLPSILAGCGFTLKQSSEGLAYYNLGGIFGAVSFGFWIGLKGSRFPMLAGSVFAIFSAVGASFLIHTSRNPSVGMFLLIAANGLFVNAVQTTMYALATHIYVTRMRATGVAAALAIGRTGAILSAFVGGYTLKLPPSLYFAILAIAMCGVWLALFVLKRHISGSEALQDSSLLLAE